MSAYRDQADNGETPKAYFPHDNGLFFFDTLVEIEVRRKALGTYEETPVVVCLLQGGKLLEYANWHPLNAGHPHNERRAQVEKNLQEAKLFVEWIANKKQRWSEHLAILSRPLPSFDQEVYTQCESE